MASLDSSVLRLVRADRIAPRATQWLIEGWLALESLAGLVAPSGACKSFLALDWACCVATGSPWKGRAVQQGAVCYLAGEGQLGLRKRILAWERATGVSIAGAPLYLSAGLPFLCETHAAAATAEEVFSIAAPVGAGLVVVDTVARAMGGANENSAEDMGRFVRAMDGIRDKCGSTVLTIHHTGNDPTTQGRARGSSAYRAALDSEYVLANVSPNEVQLTTTKAKDWHAGSPMRMRKSVVQVEVGEKVETSLYLETAQSAVSSDELTRRVLELHAQGLSSREIERELGVSKSNVHRRISTSNAVPSRGGLYTPADGTPCPVGQPWPGQAGTGGQPG